MRKILRPIITIIIAFFITIVFFAFLQSVDNKYTIKQPVGQDGIINLTENDLSGSAPVFLTDGWRMDINGSEITTFIGEYSNYMQTGLSDTPAGEAMYSMNIAYSGSETIAAVTFPELFSEFELYIDGEPAGSGKGNAAAVFKLPYGNTLLQVKVKNDSGYYSGMYFPGAISQPETISKTQMINDMCYLAAFIMAMTLSLFSFALWKNKSAGLYRRFGMFCISFCLYISYHFVHLFHMPFEEFWYLIEDIAFYFMVFSVIWLSMACAKLNDRIYLKIIPAVGIAFPVVSICLYFLIPALPYAVTIHAVLQDIYRVLVFILLTGIALYGAITKVSEYRFLLVGNCIFGAGLLINFIFSNKFEPIYTFWQLEWCGLFLVVIFAAMMVQRNKRILAENTRLTETLEQQVAIRTDKLNSLLDERRAFFSQLAHNLKAPITAANHYIQLIKSHHVDVDEELSQYIELINEKQGEITNRIETINELSRLDKITAPMEDIDLNAFMKEIYHSFKPEADVLTIYLRMELEPSDTRIPAQKEKLVILMENLICNAFDFTPPEGTVTLSTKFKEDKAVIFVEDTGCGIEQEKLPHIFNRFYVGRENKNEGSGLGLYIVKLIAEEFGGTADVCSEVGKGTRFSVIFPTV